MLFSQNVEHQYSIARVLYRTFFWKSAVCLLIGQNVQKNPKILNFENLKKWSNRGKKFSKNKFWKYFYPQNLIFSGFGPKNVHLKITVKSYQFFVYILANK